MHNLIFNKSKILWHINEIDFYNRAFIIMRFLIRILFRHGLHPTAVIDSSILISGHGFPSKVTNNEFRERVIRIVWKLFGSRVVLPTMFLPVERFEIPHAPPLYHKTLVCPSNPMWYCVLPAHNTKLNAVLATFSALKFEWISKSEVPRSMFHFTKFPVPPHM